MSKIIPALDFKNSQGALKALIPISQEISLTKIGLELFVSEGPAMIRMIRRLGVEVFLDLKLNDIPNQVVRAIKSIMRYGVVMTTIHTTGGFEMMRAAVKTVEEQETCLILLGVTLLTSFDEQELRRIGRPGTVEKQVVELAKLAQEAGLKGVVASAQEIKAIREACGHDFMIVTPGIRDEAFPDDDQVRTMNAKDAVAAGANYLVVGRPIFGADDPLAACREIKANIGE